MTSKGRRRRGGGGVVPQNLTVIQCVPPPPTWTLLPHSPQLWCGSAVPVSVPGTGMPGMCVPPPPLGQTIMPAPCMGEEQRCNTEMRLLTLIDKSGYDMVQFNGQRKMGPPRDWRGPPPGPGCEVFIGKIPRDLYEDELFPLLSNYGRVYELRLMMDFSGTNRGFGFAQFATPEEARHVVESLDGYAVRPGKYLGVMKSLDNRRLFVGGLPKDRTKEQIRTELDKLVQGIVDVILYSSVVDKTKNRGFAFVEFESHRVAAIARRKMIPGGVVLWDHDLAVDWAEPEPEVPDSIMAKVKVLYMRNLMLSTTESTIRTYIETVGEIPQNAIEKVKKLKDFAFLHFSDRMYAEKALPRLNNITIDNSVVTVVWAKPPRERLQNAQDKSNLLYSQSSSLCFENASVSTGCSTPGMGSRAITGAPNLDCYNSPTSCLPAPMPIVQYSPPFGYWETLVSLSQSVGEPVVELQTVSNPSKMNASSYVARITLPGLQHLSQNAWMGLYCDTPMAARESAAEVVFNQLFGGPPMLSMTSAASPNLGLVYSPHYVCGAP